MLSATDQKEAIASGAYGVKCAIEGETGKMIGFSRVEGGDYRVEDIAGHVEVQQNGGQVIILPFVEGCSTTNIVRRIQDAKS